MDSMAQDVSRALPRPVYRAPALPDKARRDWGRAVDRGLLGIAGIVTFGVGNWSIATVLHEAGAPGVAAVGAAGVFDLIAVSAAWRVHRQRLTPHRAYGAQIVMLLSLVASMAVNAAHGWAMGGWMVAMVLGAVPLAFEVVWAMQHGIKPWSVRRQFKDEARELVRRDVHAALYGMTLDLLPAADDEFPTAGTAVVTHAVSRRNLPKRALSAAPVPAMTNIVPALAADGPDKRTVSAGHGTDGGPLVRTGFQSARVAVRTAGQPDKSGSDTRSGQPHTVTGLVRTLVSAGLSADLIRARVSATFPDSNAETVSRTVRREVRRAG